MTLPDKKTFETMTNVIEAYERIVYGSHTKRVRYEDFLKRPQWQHETILNTISRQYTEAINSRLLTKATNPNLEN